jgi:uncharacterized membrane protein YccC
MPGGSLSREELPVKLLDCTVLAVAAVVSYWLVSHVLSQVHSVSAVDDQIGGLWAVIAALFVCRISYDQSAKAAVTRVSATGLSFALCLVYLVFLPFHLWALALLVAVTALAALLIGRPGDVTSAAVSSGVVMVSAHLSPHDEWQQPVLRFADTLVGVAVGIAAAWLGLRIIQPRLERRLRTGQQTRS